MRPDSTYGYKSIAGNDKIQIKTSVHKVYLLRYNQEKKPKILIEVIFWFF
jgi:hypothetical protein